MSVILDVCQKLSLYVKIAINLLGIRSIVTGTYPCRLLEVGDNVSSSRLGSVDLLRQQVCVEFAEGWRRN
jgi:hypothetical protein